MNSISVKKNFVAPKVDRLGSVAEITLASSPASVADVILGPGDPLTSPS